MPYEQHAMGEDQNTSGVPAEHGAGNDALGRGENSCKFRTKTAWCCSYKLHGTRLSLGRSVAWSNIVLLPHKARPITFLALIDFCPLSLARLKRTLEKCSSRKV